MTIPKPTRNPILLALMLGASGYLRADVNHMQMVVGISKSVRTRSIEVGPEIGNDPRLMVGPSLEFIQALHTNQREVRFHINGWAYGRPIDGDTNPTFDPFVQVSVFASAGGITGLGLGGRLALGFRIKAFSLSAFGTIVEGRRNPWDGSQKTTEGGIQFAVRFP